MKKEKLTALRAVVLNVCLYLGFGVSFGILIDLFVGPARLPLSVLLESIGRGSVVLCLVIMTRQSYSITFAEMGLKYRGLWQDILYGALLGASLSLVAGLLSDVMGPMLPEWGKVPQRYDFVALYRSSQGAWRAILLFVFIVSTSIIEEIFYRGIVQSVLRRAFSFLATLLLSSGLFGLFHVYPELAIPAFVIGCGLTLLREWRKSLVGPITAHATGNCLALIFSDSG